MFARSRRDDSQTAFLVLLSDGAALNMWHVPLRAVSMIAHCLFLVFDTVVCTRGAPIGPAGAPRAEPDRIIRAMRSKKIQISDRSDAYPEAIVLSLDATFTVIPLQRWEMPWYHYGGGR